MTLFFSKDWSPTKTPLFLLAAAATLALSSAEFITAAGPWVNATDIRADEFPNWNRSPNATAIIPVAGWDLTKPYPGLWEGTNTQPGGGWTLQLNITANVTNTKSLSPVTRISAQLRPPPDSIFDAESGNWSVPEDVSSSWKMYMLIFEEREGSDLNVSATSVNRGDDPQKSCEGFMSVDCMSNMRKVVQEQVNLIAYGSTAFTNGVYKAAGCPTWGSMSTREVFFNSSFTRQTGYYHQIPADGRPEYANAYDYYGTRMYASMLIWSYSNLTLVPGNFQPSRDSLADDHVTFICARANQTVGESRLPGEEEGSSGAGGRMELPSVGMLLLLIGLGFVLELMM